MRLAPFLRLRRRLLMYSGNNYRSLSSSHGALKRSSPDPPQGSTSKVPRVDQSSFSFTRNATSGATLPTYHPPHHEMPHPTQNMPRSSSGFNRSGRPMGSRQQQQQQAFGRGKGKGKAQNMPRVIEGPLHDQEWIDTTYPDGDDSLLTQGPKYAISNARYKMDSRTTQGTVLLPDGTYSSELWRSHITVHVDPPIYGVGDNPMKKKAEELAALSAYYQLVQQGFILKTDIKSASLSDGTTINLDQAKSFMDFYCRRFNFRNPEIAANEIPGGWEATMTVGDRRIGMGTGTNKKAATAACYLDVVAYLEKCDPALWTMYLDMSKKGDLPGYAPSLYFVMSGNLTDEIRDLCIDIKKSNLYRNRPKAITGGEANTHDPRSTVQAPPTKPRWDTQYMNPNALSLKSRDLSIRRKQYLENPALERMRATRQSLPVYTRAEEVMTAIKENDVTILMAATGSGKTTQIPQLLLDSYIDAGEGAKCNVICTQPRRLAALSVADRVAKERGERLGQSIGYQVRFEAKTPEDNGSVTFCTTGVFLKRLQSALSENGGGNLDHVTHVVVDEVHERDVDTDLLLVVLKRLLAVRKAQGKPIKVVLMSATIDPTLFQNYFLDDKKQPAKVIQVPGRSFPVTKYFMDDFVENIVQSPMKWVFNDDAVAKYVANELGPNALPPQYRSSRPPATKDEELDIPYPLVAATISHVLQKSDSGHVLVFLAGWDDIVATQRSLLTPNGPLGININDKSKYSLHLLHSTIPLVEQQVIFEPPSPGVRRIILATNIAETSVTIPDVVYVIDTARLKEQRYDPERHIMSLVSAWVGSSNLNQRAGRAGRHRPGDYFGMLGRKRADALAPYQTVEMSRVDLTNVAMHVKALNFPGMSVEEVLAATIEPPEEARVVAAMNDLKMVGAVDAAANLTSLGRVLLELPVDVQVGRLVLYGSFFRCLDQALTLAAILTNREPFVSPMHLKAEANAKKNSWTPQNFKSDALATLQAYNAWEEIQNRRDYVTANRFCIDNFIAKPTLLMIQKIKGHLLQSLYRAGVINVSAGGGFGEQGNDRRQASHLSVPPELNQNSHSLPLLAALIALASQPKFAIRTGEKGFRTQQDKLTFIHPSSVNHRKHEVNLEDDPSSVKQIYAFAEKRRNISIATNGSPMTFLVTTTRLDPMTYVLFGAHKVESSDKGLKCDGWVPIVGHIDGLEDVSQLKSLMDACMLRVYEGIIMGRRQRRDVIPLLPREEESEAWDDDDDAPDYSLSRDEVKELDLLSRDIVGILNKYSEERIQALSRQNSRPSTPSTPFASRLRPTSSSHATPYGSRAPTPLGRLRRF